MRNERGGIVVRLLGVVALLAGVIFVAPAAARLVVHQVFAHATMTATTSHRLGERQAVPPDLRGRRPPLAITADRYVLLDSATRRVAVHFVIRNRGSQPWTWHARQYDYVLDNHGERHYFDFGVRTSAGRPLPPEVRVLGHRAVGGWAVTRLDRGHPAIQVDISVFPGHPVALSWAVGRAG